MGGLTLAATALIVPSAMGAGASTNGDSTTFFGVACQTILPVSLDIESQVVVPNQVNQGDTYTVTVPGGETALPTASSGLDVNGYKNLSQSYLFSSSAGDVTVLDINPSESTAINEQAFRTAQWVSTTPVFIDNIVHSAAAGGTLTFTTTSPHGFSAGQAITSVGNAAAGYNFDSRNVAAVTNPTTFTVTGVGASPGNLTAKGYVARTSGTNPAIIFTTAGPHDLTAGQTLKTQRFEPEAYNVDTEILSVNPLQLAVAAGDNPGPVTTPGFMDIGRTVAGAGQIGGRKVTITNAMYTTAQPFVITNATWTNAKGGTLTFTTATPHSFAVGNNVMTSGNTPIGYNFASRPVDAVPNNTTFTVVGVGANPGTISVKGAAAKTTGNAHLVFTTIVPHSLSAGMTVSTTGNIPAGYNRTNGTVSTNALTANTFSINVAGTSDPGPNTTKGVVEPNEPNVVTASTPTAKPGLLITPDVEITLKAPSADATVTSYLMQITTTAVLAIGLEAAVTCNVPHTNPQTDGLSATLVGAGGPTTVPKPECPTDTTTTSTTAPLPTCVVTTTTSSTTTTEEPTTSTTEEPTTTTTEEPTTTTTTPESTTTTTPEETTTTTTPESTTTTTTPDDTTTTTSTSTTTTSTSTSTSTSTTTTSTTTTSTTTTSTTTSTSTTTTTTPPEPTTTTTAPPEPTTTSTVPPLGTTTTTVDDSSTTTTTIVEEGSSTADVSDTKVGPGGSLTISGEGWLPNSTVDIELHSDPVSLGSADVDSDGTFSTTVVIPADTPAGDHTIVVSGTDADGNPATQTIAITIEGDDTGSSGGDDGGPSNLPFTGGPVLPLLFVGIAMLVSGAALSRRRTA